MLSKRVKYAIKALLFLDKQEARASVSAKKISEHEKIPYKFLEQILRELKQHKILKSERGAEGGYSFMKPANAVKIVDIMRIIDGPIAMVSCASLNFYEKCGDCADEEICKIRKIMISVRDSTLPVLDKSITELNDL